MVNINIVFYAKLEIATSNTTQIRNPIVQTSLRNHYDLTLQVLRL